MAGDGPEMLWWLACACANLRRQAGRKQINVAIILGVDQRTIGRFENSKSWPRDPDEVVRAYAEDLEVHPLHIWRTAIDLWEADRASTA